MTDHMQQYQHELGAMRGAVDAFSRAYPAVASELRLSAGHSADPHVEQLLQSFAWLTGQLRHDLQQQRDEIPNHLLLSLYPNLLRSLPCMTVMSANVLADGANFVNGCSLEKGRLFSTQSVSRRSADGSEMRAVECRMQCCYDTPLWPLAIEDIAVKPKNVFDFLDNRADTQSVISIELRSEGTDPIYEYPLDKLRFFIADPVLRPNLHQLLSNNFRGCAIRVGDQIIELPKAKIDWLGFAEEHSVLPQVEGGHSAYRLLQEYFFFPEKFYFFEVSGLQVDQVADKFELLLLLDQADASLNLNSNSLTINSFPAINLFPATFKPVQLDHSCYEYRLLADETQYGQSEVHSITDVRLLSADGRVSKAAPWLGGESVAEQGEALAGQQPLHYLSRLAAPLSPATPGCDTMISLQDESLAPAKPVDQTMSVKGLCSNRKLAESLRVGNSLKLVGAGALLDATVVSRPTLFKGAKLQGESTVQLLSQLHLNQTALVDWTEGRDPLEKFRRLLNLYCDPMTPSHQRQIDGIVELTAAPSVRRMGGDAWRGHYRGTCLTLTVEETFFDGANPLLLGEVLSHFFGLYTTINHFVQLQLVSYQREGVWQQWHPRIGEQVIL